MALNNHGLHPPMYDDNDDNDDDDNDDDNDNDDDGGGGIGVDVLNNAMDNVYTRALPEKWVYVDVSIAPSTITITEYGVTTVICLSTLEQPSTRGRTDHFGTKYSTPTMLIFKFVFKTKLLIAQRRVKLLIVQPRPPSAVIATNIFYPR